MTPKEFKAWFEGFTESFASVPTKSQWTRIKDRVAEIDGKETTERVFIDRYWPNWPHWLHYNTGGTFYSSPTIPRWVTITNAPESSYTHGNFVANTAMYALGKADAASG